VLQKISQTERFHVFALLLLYRSQYSLSATPFKHSSYCLHNETLLVVEHSLITAQVKEKEKLLMLIFFVVISQKLFTKMKKMSFFVFSN